MTTTKRQAGIQTTSVHPATPSIVGLWQVTIKIEGLPESFEGLYTFFADGNFLEVNALKETNPGVWMGSGNTYGVTFWAFNYDEQGHYTLKAKVRGSIGLEGADQLTGQGLVDVYDLAGNLVEQRFSGPFQFTGTRLEVELP